MGPTRLQAAASRSAAALIMMQMCRLHERLRTADSIKRASSCMTAHAAGFASMLQSSFAFASDEGTIV
jgi:hypothetical protein